MNAAAPQTPRESRNDRAPRILVVEDEAALAYLLVYNLEAEGYQVEHVDHGDEAELRIAESGEVLYRSPGVFKEYFKNLEATNDTKTADGWVHTGDAGYLDDKGRPSAPCQGYTLDVTGHTNKRDARRTARPYRRTDGRPVGIVKLLIGPTTWATDIGRTLARTAPPVLAVEKI